MDAPDTITEQEQKAAFAALLYQNKNNPLACAMQVFPNDIGSALKAAHNWRPEVDKYVADIMASLSAIPESALPTKEMGIQKIWKLIEDCNDPEIVVKLMDRLAKLEGWDVKEQAAAPTVIVDNRKVYEVRDYGTDEDWEKAAKRQQDKLTSVANATRH